jgi:hypothetical protein
VGSVRDMYRDAIERFPKGCTVRHKRTGTLALVGDHTSAAIRCSFWLMTLGDAPPKCGIVGAAEMLRDYEVQQ